jgi:hypothetical protein
MSDSVESRIVLNAHFADHLRTKLLRRASPAAREILSRMSNEDLVAAYLKNEQLGKEHAAKLRAAKETSL